MSSSARLRDRQVLDAQIEALRVHVDRARDREDVTADFARGALKALGWVTAAGPGPLTGALAVAPVALERIVAELAAAEDIIYGRSSRQRDYARGVEHALMWAQFATAAPPLSPSPQEASPLAGRTSGARR
ncbi:MAG: hypothetical protein J0I49_14900 [Pseudonocardia sp.]|jgi:hypothetical protein|uniref:hypothetical protein n=1 Tax=Pseudonocardia sp. TaxID=60912 RepID=UPI001AD07151|nr:hypothetical protein [Pseudonocardia sp.]MBN9099382.1 hypothetical protein [Pseudonocardia sp.]